MNLLSKLREYFAVVRDIQARLDRIQRSLGRIENRQIALNEDGSLHQNEFQVYSQWGEDGIIQFLLRRVPIEHRVFIEFGVHDYLESNTRFLVQYNNWSGLVMDGTAANVEAIKRDPIYWRCNIKAECAFITRENINELISHNGISGDVGLLSVDIDGNDYWVWEAITCITPRIVVAEYNSRFGPSARVTIPYDSRFIRTRAHYSNLYWGASLGALCELGRNKGYSLVGSNSAGCNAFFIRNDVLGDLEVLTAEKAWVEAQFRESCGPSGELTFLDQEGALREIGHLPVFDLACGRSRPLRDAIGMASPS